MSDKYISLNQIATRLNNQNRKYHIDSRTPLLTELADIALTLSKNALFSGDFIEMQKLFDRVADDIEKLKKASVPDHSKIKFSTSALEIYLHTKEKDRHSDYESFSHEVIGRLNQEVSRHLDNDKIFI